VTSKGHDPVTQIDYSCQRVAKPHPDSHGGASLQELLA
jgi:hypothetical protein